MKQDPQKTKRLSAKFFKANKPGGVDPLSRFGERVGEYVAQKGRGSFLTEEIKIEIDRSYEEFVKVLFDRIYGEGASKENPELFIKFKAEVDEVLKDFSDEQKKELLAVYLDRFLTVEVEESSHSKHSEAPCVEVSSAGREGLLRSFKGSLGSLGNFGALVLGAVAAGGCTISNAVRSELKVQSSDDTEQLVVAESSDSESGVKVSERVKISEEVDELLESLHKQYRETILESLRSLAEEKGRQERNRLFGIFSEDSDEVAKKAKRLADTEHVIEEARVVLSAFRGTDMHAKIEKIAERLTQIHNINRAFQSKVRLWDLVEAADVGGFSVLT